MGHIAAIISAIISILKNIWEVIRDREKRKLDAIKSGHFEVDKKIYDIKKTVNADLDKELRNATLKLKKPVNKLENIMKGYKNISIELENKITEIKKSQIRLSLLLASDFLGDNIEFSYIDLSEMVVVGEIDYQTPEELARKFRVKKFNLYQSWNHWLSDVEIITSSNNVLVVNDEFNYRAINAYLLHDTSTGYKRVEKR